MGRPRSPLWGFESPQARNRPPGRRLPIAAAPLAYLLFAGLWAFGFDRLVASSVPGDLAGWLETFEGPLAVLLTALFLWIVLRRDGRARLEAEGGALSFDPRLGAVLDALGATLLAFLTKEPFRIVQVTEGIEALTGVSQDDLLSDPSRTVVDLIQPEDRRRVVTAARASARDGLPFRFEFRLQTRDGSPRWVRCHGRSIADGAVVELVLIDPSPVKESPGDRG